jgi:hypothetical protein
MLKNLADQRWAGTARAQKNTSKYFTPPVRTTPGECKELAHLFAGAIGSYENPRSHRTVNFHDAARRGRASSFAAGLADEGRRALHAEPDVAGERQALRDSAAPLQRLAYPATGPGRLPAKN